MNKELIIKQMGLTPSDKFEKGLVFSLWNSLFVMENYRPYALSWRLEAIDLFTKKKIDLIVYPDDFRESANLYGLLPRRQIEVLDKIMFA